MSWHIWKKKKLKGTSMTRAIVLTTAALVSGSAAMAHPGAHLHPHDGASWLTIANALGVMAVAGGLALARSRR